MTIQRMDNVGVVVDDLEAATAFFAELGMELEGEVPLEGRWVDHVVGLDDVRVDVAMMRTPDGHGRLELTKFHTPTAVSAEPENAPANALGIRRIMFAVEILRTSWPPADPRRRTRWRAGAVRGQVSALLLRLNGEGLVPGLSA
jgi:catechol 2,3-dioxygenase-like lactoylglutathione lyase family enzyme